MSPPRSEGPLPLAGAVVQSGHVNTGSPRLQEAVDRILELVRLASGFSRRSPRFATRTAGDDTSGVNPTYRPVEVPPCQPAAGAAAISHLFTDADGVSVAASPGRLSFHPRRAIRITTVLCLFPVAATGLRNCPRLAAMVLHCARYACLAVALGLCLLPQAPQILDSGIPLAAVLHLALAVTGGAMAGWCTPEPPLITAEVLRIQAPSRQRWWALLSLAAAAPVPLVARAHRSPPASVLAAVATTLGAAEVAFLLCYACRVLHGWHQQTTHWVNFVQVQGMLDPKVYPDLGLWLFQHFCDKLLCWGPLRQRATTAFLCGAALAAVLAVTTIAAYYVAHPDGFGPHTLSSAYCFFLTIPFLCIILAKIIMITNVINIFEAYLDKECDEGMQRTSFEARRQMAVLKLHAGEDLSFVLLGRVCSWPILASILSGCAYVGYLVCRYFEQLA